MPITIDYNNNVDQRCRIRPTPFVNVSANQLKNKEGNFGVTYNITLTGTILPDEGSPFAFRPDGSLYGFLTTSPTGPLVGPFESYDKTPISSVPHARYKPPRQQVENKPAAAILSKQRALRALFAQDGQRVIISDIYDDNGGTIVCYPRVISVSFTEGQYVTKSEYTIVLEADVIMRGLTPGGNDDFVDQEGVPNSGLTGTDVSLSTLLDDENTSFVESYTENWGLETDDSQGESPVNPRSYRISHQLSAVGKTVYDAASVGANRSPTKEAWEQAKTFVQNRLTQNPSGSYPNIMGQMGSGTINLANSYGGFNHIRTENIDVAGGSYSITENWLLSSGNEIENYAISTSTSNTDPFVTVSIDGSVKGLSKLSPDMADVSGVGQTLTSGAYFNALSKYNRISNSGQFGLTSDLYKRVNNMVAVQLNSQPISIAIGTNQYAGEITYSLAFNNRPMNIISGVLAESIQINDTYPGDIFATIPVLGRATGPVLQYIGGRTEYRRDVAVNLTMDYTKIPYGSGRATLLLKKPSLVEPTASQIGDLLKELSPQGEPGIRKYFIQPPTESWNPKEGTYSYNVSFTYELDK